MNRTAFTNIRLRLFSLALVMTAGSDYLFSDGALTSARQPQPKEITAFQGKWDGQYKSDQGKAGEGKYEFQAETNGRFDGTASWEEEDQNQKMQLRTMPLKGERLGPDALRLEGTYKGTTYYYIGRMDGKALILRYLSIEGKTGISGSGVSTLTRHP